jgi:hypothetical protein
MNAPTRRMYRILWYNPSFLSYQHSVLSEISGMVLRW